MSLSGMKQTFWRKLAASAFDRSGHRLLARKTPLENDPSNLPQALSKQEIDLERLSDPQLSGTNL